MRGILRAFALGGVALSFGIAAPALAVVSAEYTQVFDAGYFDENGAAQSGDHASTTSSGTFHATFSGGAISSATSSALPGNDDPFQLKGPLVSGAIHANPGGTASVIAAMNYFVQVSGAYDDSIFVPLSADILAKISGSVTAGGSVVAASANASVSISFYANEARTLTDYDRSTYDGVVSSVYSEGSFADQVARTLTLSVHPGEIFSVHLEAHPLGYAQDGGSASANALADPYFYFAPGSSYLLSFSPGIVNAAVPVPEPASWALMLTGFGAIGAALRRRRATAFA